MKIVMFYHSLVSDWNHGNAHFLRGIASEFILRGYKVEVWEGENSWSRKNLIKDTGSDKIDEFRKYYPLLTPRFYNDDQPELESIVEDADIVILHEWNEHSLVASAGRLKKKYGYKLFFHDTHHRSVTEEEKMKDYDLSEYDGVVAFGDIIRDKYLENGWTKKAWTIHEAADINVFYPQITGKFEGDIVWVGNWGDEERSEEIREFLIKPIKDLKLKCSVYGVRYPDSAVNELNKAGIKYKGWIANYKVPELFGRYKITIHIPRGPYVKALPGIPTIRPFEAMASGIPLISTSWDDKENLFTPGKDFIFVSDVNEMKENIQELLNSSIKREELSTHALNTIRTRHSCVHRVNQFCKIFEETGINELKDIMDKE
jgi:spore maturation protein CgeB